MYVNLSGSREEALDFPQDLSNSEGPPAEPVAYL